MFAPSSRRTVADRLARAVTALAVVAGLAVGTVGFAVTPGGPAGDGAYPCQGGTCGCRSAAQCWSHCCCTTPAQRLAWAKSHGVTPPAELQAAVRDAAPSKSAPRSCCAGHDRTALCAVPSLLARRNQAAPRSKPATASTEQKPRPLSLIAAARCRGLGTWWVAGGQPLALPDARLTAPRPLAAGTTVASFVRHDFSAAAPPSPPG